MYPATPAHYLHAKSVTCICCLSTGMRGEQISKEVIIHTSYYMLCQMTCYFLVINCLSLFLQYYFKTGTCKFGSNCKYHHPKQDGSVQSVILNNGGFPLRPGEKECSYYMKTGQCKFGTTCKFHHPEFGGIPVTPGIYPPLQSASVPSPHTYAPLANWQMGRSPVVPGSYIPGSYTPMMLSSGMVPLQGWSPYPVYNLDKMLYF